MKSIKKILKADGDRFMRRRKKELIPDEFMNYAMAQLPQDPKPVCVRYKYVFAAAMLAVIAICSIAAVPMLKRSDNSSGTVNTTQNGTVFEPPLWVGYVETPYAIVKIKEISNETIRLSQNGVLQQYVKVNGEVILSYNTERFEGSNSSMNGADSNSSNVIAFNDIKEFYVTEDSIDQLSGLDTIFINVVKMNMDGKFYFGPTTNDKGLSEYIPITNGELQIKDEDYNTRSFASIKILNDTLDDLKDYLERGGEETDFIKALPTNKIVNGTTIEEADIYFKAWNNAKALYKFKHNSM